MLLLSNYSYYYCRLSTFKKIHLILYFKPYGCSHFLDGSLRRPKIGFRGPFCLNLHKIGMNPNLRSKRRIQDTLDTWSTCIPRCSALGPKYDIENIMMKIIGTIVSILSVRTRRSIFSFSVSKLN